jgi:hypothetical protein
VLREQFHRDYAKVDAIASRLLNSFTPENRAALAGMWSEFDSAVRARLDLEECELVPLLLRAHRREATAVVQENRQLRHRLAEIGAAISSLNSSEVRTFIDELRAHARHEQAIIGEL